MSARRPMRLTGILPLLAAALLAVALTSPAAVARDYIVHSCRAPDGRFAPTDGWTTGGGDVAYSWFVNGCSRGQPLSAGLFGTSQPANRSNVGWGFDSGPAVIRSYRITRWGNVRGFNGAASMLLFSSDARNSSGGGHAIDYCAAYRGCSQLAGTLERSLPQIPEGSRGWFMTLGCGGTAGASCPLASGASDFGSLSIAAASFTLDDSEPPATSAADGPLAQTGSTAGEIAFSATDEISGIRRAVLEVDGREVAQAAPEATGGRCTEVGLAGTIPDFFYRRPCPGRAQLELTLPVGLLSPGDHRLRARVFDAAGNAATAFGPRLVQVAAPPAEGPSGVRFVPDGSRMMRASYGRTLRMGGLLTTAFGQPLAGASVDVFLTSSAASRSRIQRRLTTDTAGRYVFRFKATASRRLQFRHPASGAEVEQSLTVRSGVRLRAARTSVPSLGRMTLAGEIETERARRGASVAIEVRNGRGWRAVGIARSDRRGRFVFRYRFRRTRHARFTFRAVALASGDLAVSPRPSNRVLLRVG